MERMSKTVTPMEAAELRMKFRYGWERSPEAFENLSHNREMIGLLQLIADSLADVRRRKIRVEEEERHREWLQYHKEEHNKLAADIKAERERISNLPGPEVPEFLQRWHEWDLSDIYFEWMYEEDTEISEYVEGVLDEYRSVNSVEDIKRLLKEKDEAIRAIALEEKKKDSKGDY